MSEAVTSDTMAAGAGCVPFAATFTREVLTELALEYAIPLDRHREFERWLRTGYANYISQRWSLAPKSQRIGDAAAAQRLFKAVQNALMEMRSSEMQLRLTLAGEMTFPMAAPAEHAPWLPQTLATLERLEKTAKAALWLDDKKARSAEQTRYDVRAFALALRHFWTQILNRSGAPGDNDEGRNPFVSFALDCILRVDGSATGNHIIDLANAEP